MGIENSAYIIMSGVKAKMKELDYLANEATKTDVVGHKTEKFVYDEYRKADVSYLQDQDLATYRDVSDGALKMTGEPLDLAILGDAYFSFETEEGVRYGTAGHLTMNDEGAIADLNGHRLLDVNGQPIILDAGATNLRVNENGLIVSNGEELQQIGVFTFANTQLMNKIGQNLYEAGIDKQTGEEQIAEVAVNAKIFQGALEESNVNRIEIMTNSIEVQRAIGLMSNLLGSFEELERSTVKTLVKPN